MWKRWKRFWDMQEIGIWAAEDGERGSNRRLKQENVALDAAEHITKHVGGPANPRSGMEAIADGVLR
jgi:hypothetical protein